MAIPKRCVGSKVCVLQFSIFSCAHLRSSARDLFKAPQVEHICGIRGHWCQVIVFRRIGRLLNPSRKHYNIFVRLSRHFWVFFSPILLFFAHHDVKWRPCISTLRPIDTMTQVCHGGTYFGA